MAHDRLRLASVEITRRCNNACPYCDQPKAEQDMPIAQFSALLDTLIGQGVEAVALGGGEPTLHPALPALLAAARQRGLRVGLTTNARATDLVADLADRGLLDSFGVSAGKGAWTALAGHPAAVVNLLLLAGGLQEVTGQAIEALRHGAAPAAPGLQRGSARLRPGPGRAGCRFHPVDRPGTSNRDRDCGR